MFDFLVPAKTRRRRALESRLSDEKQSVAAVFQDGYDAAALESILAMPPKKEAEEKLHERAALLRAIAQAGDALKKGDIVPALEVAKKSFGAFDLLVADKKNLSALKAKMEVFTRSEFNNPPGDFDDRSFSSTINFASRHALEAVDGYADLEMDTECQEAMESYLTHSHYGERDRLQEWVDGFREKPSCKGQAAVRIAAARGKEFSFEDHLAIIRSHDDEALRVTSIGKLHQTVRDAEDYDQGIKQAFDVLLEHIATQEGQQPTASQAAAMHALNNTFDGLTDMHYARNPDTPRLYQSAVISETKKNAPHVIKEVFGDYNRTTAFLVKAMQLDFESGGKGKIGITDLLPSEEKGPSIAAARNHFAKQYLEVLSSRYQAPAEGAALFSNRHKEDAAVARQVALLTRDVLSDETLPKGDPQKKRAEDLLRQLVVTEDYKLASDGTSLEKFMESKESWEYKREAKNHVVERAGQVGFGRAAVETLADIVNTPESREIAARISATAGPKKDHKIQEIGKGLGL